MITIIAAGLKENAVSEVFLPCSQGHISKPTPFTCTEAPAVLEKI
jgi:hypothetical protein